MKHWLVFVSDWFTRVVSMKNYFPLAWLEGRPGVVARGTEIIRVSVQPWEGRVSIGPLTVIGTAVWGSLPGSRMFLQNQLMSAAGKIRGSWGKREENILHNYNI